MSLGVTSSLMWLGRKKVGPAVYRDMVETGPATPRPSHESVACGFLTCLS